MNKESQQQAKVDYKDTLNLPQTSFPMKANLSKREPGCLANWQQAEVYQKLRVLRAGAKPFILQDGPPYANGDIHIGHALNKILKDIIIKAKNLSGFDAPFVPGWDCHGLPIELQVEKKIGKCGNKVSANTFRQHCRDYAAKQIETQKHSFQRLGILADWDNYYASMDKNFEADTVRLLSKLIDGNNLQPGYKPVHWCVACGSALAEAEVEYMEKKSAAIDVFFLASNNSKELEALFGELPCQQLGVVIWTTTPWTLPANQGVSVHPEYDYAICIDNDLRGYIVARQLVDTWQQRTQLAIKIHKVVKGASLVSLKLQHPWFAGRQVGILLGEHVTLDMGTGCVHTAPAHGLDDYIIGNKYSLVVESLVDANGCYVASVPEVAQMQVFAANANIIAKLHAQGTLLHNHEFSHQYPHCWRHKSPLIFRATPQWFLPVTDGLRQSLLAAADKVTWLPVWGHKRITAMLQSRPDWCLSRQRAWGIPLALLVHRTTGALHPNMSLIIKQIADKIAEHGMDYWFDSAVSDWLTTGAEDYIKVMDILDVWFDSGAVHACVLPRFYSGLANDYIADLYLEGSDQHRGWFQTSMLLSMATTAKAPYKQVLTHGFTVDAEGRKMSKSQGNVVAPQKVIDKYGADVLRLWVASTDYRAELHVSDEILQRVSDAYRKMRNTARFVLSNLFDFQVEQHLLPADKLLALDLWVVKRTLVCEKIICKAYEDYQPHLVYQTIYQFCVNELGGIYLDIIKDRQYTTSKNSLARRSAQTSLWLIAESLVRWFAPILSFTAEEIWQELAQFSTKEREPSVLLATWYAPLLQDYLQSSANDEVYQLEYWQRILAIRTEVNKALECARNDNIIGSGLEAEVILFAKAEELALLSKLTDELRFVLITSEVQVLSWEAKVAAAKQSCDVPGIALMVKRASGPKCERCWHRRTDVGDNKDYPGVCKRCVINITTVSGEVRYYA